MNEIVDSPESEQTWVVVIKHMKYNMSHPPYSIVALVEWLRHVPSKYMGFPRESSNLSSDVHIPLFSLFIFFSLIFCKCLTIT